MKLSGFTRYAFSLASVAVLAASCGNEISDEEIQKKIGDHLRGNENYIQVSAAVADHGVTLNGSCIGEGCAIRLEEEVRQLEGVTEVTNNVQEGSVTTDYTLRTSVQTVISKYEGVQADVANGAVVLRGTIDKSQVQPLMTELNTLGAKEIDNQLAVQ